MAPAHRAAAYVPSVSPPVPVWIVGLLIALMAFASMVGPFLFAFPLGGLLGYGMGTALLVFGIGYGVVLWRLRRGERKVWKGALLLPLLHTLTLNTTDLVRYGAIPKEDYPFMAVAGLIVALLLLPSTRRFFRK